MWHLTYLIQLAFLDLISIYACSSCVDRPIPNAYLSLGNVIKTGTVLAEKMKLRNSAVINWILFFSLTFLLAKVLWRTLHALLASSDYLWSLKFQSEYLILHVFFWFYYSWQTLSNRILSSAWTINRTGTPNFDVCKSRSHVSQSGKGLFTAREIGSECEKRSKKSENDQRKNVSNIRRKFSPFVRCV